MIEVRLPVPKTATPVAVAYSVLELVPKVKAPKLLIFTFSPMVTFWPKILTSYFPASGGSIYIAGAEV